MDLPESGKEAQALRDALERCFRHFEEVRNVGGEKALREALAEFHAQTVIRIARGGPLKDL